jgi:methylase of polypeptide subunit release factors
VDELVGGDALARARRALAGYAGHAAGVLSLLFDRERSVSASELTAAVGPEGLGSLCDLGLARPQGEDIVPLVRIERAAGPLVASDLRGHRLKRDFVVGPGPGSLLLAAFVRRPKTATRVLDLGCGAGFQALRLATGGVTALAIDISDRAVDFARFNAALGGLATIQVVAGDFLGGPLDRSLEAQFDVVVANPPFVLAPSCELVYRDRSLPGDEVTRCTIDRVVRALARGGRGYVLGNWIERDERDWSDPVAAWTSRSGRDVHVTRITSADPAAYAALWTRDLAPADQPAAAAAWSAALRAEGVRRIHTGVIAIGRPAGRRWAGRRFGTADATRGFDPGRVESFLAT